MKGKIKNISVVCVSILIGFVLASQAVWAKEVGRTWNLVKPEGITIVEPIKINPHPASLEGKTIGLRWNGKPNGDIFLDRIAELLTQKVPGTKVVKLYKVDPMTIQYHSKMTDAVKSGRFIAKKLKEMDVDLVIGSQGD